MFAINNHFNNNLYPDNAVFTHTSLHTRPLSICACMGVCTVYRVYRDADKQVQAITWKAKEEYVALCRGSGTAKECCQQYAVATFNIIIFLLVFGVWCCAQSVRDDVNL